MRTVLLLSLVLAISLACVNPVFTQPEVAKRASSIVNQLTLDEKLDLLGGVDGFFIRGVPRLNFPRLKMADGPIGVRNFGPATGDFAILVGRSSQQIELQGKVKLASPIVTSK